MDAFPVYDHVVGWVVAGVPIVEIGKHRDDVEMRWPARWLSVRGPDGEIDPTDLEVAWTVHVLEHEIARARGDELTKAIQWGCGLDDVLVPVAGLAQAAADGQSLVGYCSGISWFWPQGMENRPKEFRARIDLTG